MLCCLLEQIEWCHKAILFTSSHPQVFGAPRRRQKLLAFFCKIVILVRAHKLVIAARSSNDGCYVASRNRLNCSKAILFMSDHLQEVATSLGSHFYHIIFFISILNPINETLNFLKKRKYDKFLLITVAHPFRGPSLHMKVSGWD